LAIPYASRLNAVEKFHVWTLARPDLIYLALGMPIPDTPDAIKEATVAALRAGHVHYSDFKDIPELRAALVDKMREQNDLDFTPDEIIVTNGLTQASFLACKRRCKNRPR